MTERRNANLFEVLICQIRQDDKTDVVLSKALRVLSEVELLKPFGDLLHRAAPRISGFIRPRWKPYLRSPQVVAGYGSRAGATGPVLKNLRLPNRKKTSIDRAFIAILKRSISWDSFRCCLAE